MYAREMDDDLERELLARLLAEEGGAPDDVANLVWAACEGHDALAANLSLPVEQRKPAAVRSALPVAAADVGGTFIEAIEVEGFRGVGNKVLLELSPGPGLTLIVGRNGCGKSSLAEGLEALLTAQSARFEGRPKEWMSSWQNLHVADGPTRVAARFTVVGRGRLLAQRVWPRGAALSDGALRITNEQGAQVSPEELGWTAALREQRPFLSYSELGKLAQEPSKAFDALHVVLGLEALGAARERLADALSPMTKRHKDKGGELKALLGELSALDDPRAQALKGLLGAKALAADDVFALCRQHPSTDGEGEAQRLARVEKLSADVDTWTSLAARWRDARDRRAQVADESLARQASLARLLSDALRFLEAGDAEGPCPVCERDLGPALIARVRTRQEEAHALAGAFEQANRALGDVERDLASARSRLPRGVLAEAHALLPDTLVSSALAAQHALTTAAQPDELELAAQVYAEALAPLVDATRVRLAGLDAGFRQVARKVERWLALAAQVADEDADRKRLDKAKTWLSDAEADIRAARFLPIGDEVRNLWSKLGAQSDVSLEAVSLVGKGTRRGLDLQARVGEQQAPALAVMSQGEMSALALALFLPRTALAQSPFRFVVIDDPVQAMDPIRVDGLASILGDAGKTRQVIVLSHDERLVEAVQRLQIPANVLRVERRGQSSVTLALQRVAHEAYLDDARKVAKSGLGPELSARVVPTFCRSALEAAATAAYRRRRLRAGEAPHHVANAVADARTLMQVLALGLFDDAERTGDVFRAVNTAGGQRAGDCVRDCKEGAHGATRDLSRLVDLVKDTERLAAWLVARDRASA
jgi:ABC-type lipoprotein export system ATPase subunit